MNESLDLAGFTALTEAHTVTVTPSTNATVDVVEIFEGMADRAVTPPVRVVKLIGDAVMLAGPEPGAVVRAVLELTRSAHATPGFPLLRGGVHEGPVIARHGDLFGATVNVAARLASAGEPGQVLATASVAARADAEGVAVVHEIGPRVLRNVSEPVVVFSLTEAESHHGPVTDPVCRMRIDPATKVVLVVEDREIWFCSDTCSERYAAHPERYPLPIFDPHA